MRRRDSIRIIGTGMGLGALAPGALSAAGRHDFIPAQLLPRGLEKAPYPSALRSMMVQLMRRTSIDADTDKVDLRIGSEFFFRYPFLYMAGREEYEDFNSEEIRRLRMLLDAGGTLFADDASGIIDSAFDVWFRRQMEKVYPKHKLEPLPEDHTLFRSFYFLNRMGGRVLLKDAVEGVTVNNRSPVLFSVNDVGGAWATDLFGQPISQCVPGGERQREMALRMGVNIIMYTLCINYKKDRVHVETILRRRKLK